MQKLEWTSALGSISKSDYEHHGMGKYELSNADPAYDLADFILSFRLSPSEEEALIRQYVNASGDSDVRRRLFFNKFQAGTWAMTSSLSNLLDKRLTHRHDEYHTRYIDAQDKEQLDELAQHLRRIPGVFLNDDYVYSLRAFMYSKNGTTSLPTPIIDTLVSDLKLHRLQVRQTSLDTAITARSVDKGKGLLALKAMVGCTDAETYAVGDSDPDIPMFAVSQRSFAPANISRARPVAKALGCTIAEGRYQRGLFQIAQKITHPGGGKCKRCDAPRNEQ